MLTLESPGELRSSFREVIMIDFERFWVKGDYNSLDEYEDPDAMAGEEPPGVGAAEIRDWEAKHGVKLPEPLRTAFGLRNGGCVRNKPLEVLPLEEIVPVDDDFWTFADIDENEAQDHSLMFVFGNETESGGTFLMNFNARGPKSTPSVYLDFHGENTYLVNDTLDGLFEAMLASSPVPSVNWSETADLSVVARASIDLSPMYRGKPASIDQVIAREGEAVVLFTRERSPKGEILTRTTLPLPLDVAWAEVRPRRPAPIASFALHLQPEESDEIVEERSEMHDDGRWKNSTQRGTPVYVMFESTDREHLESLRTQLFGAKGAARAQAKQDRQTALSETLNALSPEERTAALLQAALTMKERMDREFAQSNNDVSDMPPELANAAEMMRLKMAQMVQQSQKTIAAKPPSARTLQELEEFLRDLDGK
jgi:hypothetical protein